MPKSITAGMESHLDEVVTTLATCWKITRQDGEQYGFTDHDRDLTVDGLVYKAATGYYRSAIANSANTSVDNVDVQGFLDDNSLDETEMRNGAFDYADVKIFTVNWANLSNGILRMRSGRFGEVMIVSSGFFRVELRGLTQMFAQTIGEVYAPECRADLGDSRCKVQLQPNVRKAQTSYSLGNRILVPQDPGLSIGIPLINPGFEITSGQNNWAGAGYKVWNAEDDYTTQDHYFAQTTAESGDITYTVTLLSAGASAVPSFDLDYTCNLVGHEINVKVYWGDVGGTSAGPSYEDETGFFTPSLGDGSIATLSIPVSPGSPSGDYLYYVIEWQNDGSLPGGTVADIEFVAYPRLDGTVIAKSSFETDGLPLGAAYGWTLAGVASVTGPNVWMSPYAGDWHLVHAVGAGNTAVSTQLIDLTGITAVDTAVIDAGGFVFEIAGKWGAETSGVKNAFGIEFIDGSDATISTVDEDLVSVSGKGFWEDHEATFTVPALTRKVRIRLKTENYTNNSKARGVFDSLVLRMYEPSYENQDNYLGYGGVEFQCTTAGVTAAITPSFDYTLSNTTNDGSAVWTAVVPTHMFVSQITAVTDHKTFVIDGTNIDKPDDWFTWGVLEMLSGNNLKKRIEIKSWDNATKTITLALPMPYLPEVGDDIRFHTGCAKSRAICVSKFNNILNFRGEPDLPGTDQYFKVGGANSGGSPSSKGGK